MNGIVNVRITKGSEDGRFVKGKVYGFDTVRASQILEAGIGVLDPDPDKVDPNLHVVGLDDVDPEWRDRAEQAKDVVDPPNRMVTRSTRKRATRKR